MSKKLAVVAYRKKNIGDGYYDLEVLNPTGRWKVSSGPFYTNRIYLEHLSPILFGLFKVRVWVSEDDIDFRNEKEETINVCQRGVDYADSFRSEYPPSGKRNGQIWVSSITNNVFAWNSRDKVWERLGKMEKTG